MWLLHYDFGLRKFTFRPIPRWRTIANKDKVIAFIGDYEADHKKRLVDLLRKRRKLESGGFDMEPLEVLRDILRDGSFDLIGGAPQVMKVYRSCTCKPYAVFWRDKSAGTVNLLGRPLLDYEQSDYFVLNTDTMQTVKHVDVA